MASNIPAEERQMNLVVALMATQIGLTKQQILQSVSGYRQRFEAGTSQSSLERMFERDKDDLRSSGVVIEATGDFADPNNMQDARYRIPQEKYDLPEELTFSPAELALLTLAATAWRQGSISHDAHSGLRKIQSLGIEIDEPILGFAPRLDLESAQFLALREAIDACVRVSFSYVKPSDGSLRVRRVEPLALIDFDSRWHVLAFDIDAQAERTFLLSRIVGEVRKNSTKFDPDRRIDAAERGLVELQEVLLKNCAVLEIRPGSEAEMRLSRRTQRPEAGAWARVNFLDLNIFADELASYGPEIRIIEPEELRDEVINRCRLVTNMYGGGDES